MREGRETMTGVCWTNWTFYKNNKLWIYRQENVKIFLLSFMNNPTTIILFILGILVLNRDPNKIQYTDNM